MLRRQDYRGSIVMLSSEAAAPVDRPNLSKDYLAGSAPEDWLPLRPDDFYAEAKIDLRLNTEVTSIDTKRTPRRHVGGETIPYDRLLLATGASRCACRYRARTSRMCTCCARWPIPAPSLPWPMARGGRS
jgi:NADPH-dependent 2,4-dienoyl-CoA reductase/sulfur reductase-like enzyme